MLKGMLLPPGSILVASLAILILTWQRTRITRAVLAATIVVLYLLSTPVVARILIRSLQWYPPIALSNAPRAEAIVVLSAGRYGDSPVYGGDTVDALTLERLRFAARLHRATGLPVLSSGGVGPDDDEQRPMADLMADCLAQDFGVQTNWTEEASRNTAENALLSAQLLAERSIRRVYVVTHAWHLPRAMMAFQSTGLEVIPAPASDAPPLSMHPEDFLVSALALSETAYALHEWIGMAWYYFYYGFHPKRT